MSTDSPPPPLSRYLAAAGVASRRTAAAAVKAGRVTVNGQTVTDPGRRIAPGDRVFCDGHPVSPPRERWYIMLNKPRGYVCTNSDPHAARRALDLVRPKPPVRLFSAGRLDKESEGLLLFSNDGDYVEQITHPRHRIFKRYEVKLARELTAAELARARAGITDAGEQLHVEAIRPLGGRRYEITLNEGKKREIRRLTAALGAPTLRLCRVATGALELGDLPVGTWRRLTDSEVERSRRPGLPD